MRDTYGRTIDYMRISITDRCNLRCVYCMPQEGVPFLAHEELLTFEEIIKVCESAAMLGLKHVKITGGEPLVRKGVDQLIAQIKEIPEIEAVTLTTNGILLPDYMERLAKAGVDGINISLDTLDPKQYHEVTRLGAVEDALAGFHAALSYPQVTTKINCVLEDSRWQENAEAIAGLAKDADVHVRFIERMPLGIQETTGCTQEETVVALLEGIYGPMVPYQEQLGYGPSHYFSIKGFRGKIGFISAVTHKFCDQCNRIRLTSTGLLRMCLQSQEGIDLRAQLRSGCTREALAESILAGVRKKPKEHHFDRQNIETRGMSQIGG